MEKEVKQKGNKVQKTEKNKKPFFLIRWAKAIGRKFREIFMELKKVTWPTPKQVLKNTLIVGACVLVVGVFIWLFDFLASFGIKELIKLVKS